MRPDPQPPRRKRASRTPPDRPDPRPSVRQARARPVSDAAFARLVARLGPFEKRPALAVALSGGADSLALLLLLDRWARARGGRVLGLTVDHGLRPGSAMEARRVGRWLAARGIAHRILRWQGPKPARAIQATAREARYRLLARHCRTEGILHLALAHHRDDQIETFFLRLGRRSGLDGLAAMPAILEQDGVRLLRPLLAVPKSRLIATLRSFDQPWIEDPSNEDAAFERVRLRQSLPLLAAAGVDARKVAATTRALGRARAAGADAIADLLVEIEFRPGGIAALPRDWLATAPRARGLRVLARLVLAVGGGAYAPRGERLERGYQWLMGGTGRGATLGHCRFLRHRGRCYLMPEQAPAPMKAGSDGVWRPLGAASWHRLGSRHPDWAGLPAACGARLPALWRGTRLEAVPALGYRRPGAPVRPLPKVVIEPRHPLISARFAVA